MQIISNHYNIISDDSIRIDQYIGGFLTDPFLIKNKAKNDKQLHGILLLKENKLFLKLYYNNKFFKEYSFVDHYRDYTFKNLRESFIFLYKLKYSE